MRAILYEHDNTRVVLETDEIGKTERRSSVALLHIDDFYDLFGKELENTLKRQGHVEIECRLKS